MSTTTPAVEHVQYDPRRWRILPVPLSALFIALFDFLAVGIAAPSILRSLTGSVDSLGLILSAFAVSYAAASRSAARWGDRYGRRRVFLSGGTVRGRRDTLRVLDGKLDERNLRPTGWTPADGGGPTA